MSEFIISEDEFDQKMNSFGFFETRPHLALSLSGGSDSMALFCLLKKWSVRNNATFECFIVDHGLRKESYSESVEVRNLINKNQIKCNILKWEGPKPKTNLMELARIKRYELIINACVSQSILHLLTAHHQDDQIETYIMRSQRTGNTTGLSSIPSVRETRNIRIIRPLIHFNKNRLIETCKHFNYNWVSDSSNFDSKYERVRVRKCLEKIGELKKKKILKDIDYSKADKNSLKKKLANFYFKNLDFLSFGVFILDKEKFIDLNKRLKIEVIKKILTVNSGLFYPPRLNSVNLLISNIQKKNPKTLTLHSSIIKFKKNKIFFYREKLKFGVDLNVKKGEKMRWDNRFELYSKSLNIKLEIINEKNWSFIIKYFFNKEKRNLPNFIIKTLPLIKIKKKFYIPFVSSMTLIKEKGVNFYFSPKVSLT